MRRIRQPKARFKRRKTKHAETLPEMQARLQRAVDHGWRPKEALPAGIELKF